MKKSLLFFSLFFLGSNALGTSFFCSNGDILNSYVATSAGNTTIISGPGSGCDNILNSYVATEVNSNTVIVSGPNGYTGVGISDNQGNFYYND
jgi:hypothetical protein